MGSYPGADTIGIVEMQPTGGRDSLNQPIVAPVVTHLIYGCVFEPIERGPVEEQSNFITSHERAWAFMPYVSGLGIPTVDSSGAPVVDGSGNPVAAVITNANFLRPIRPYDAVAQRDYKVMGLPEVEYDMDGIPDHSWITCEWREG